MTLRLSLVILCALAVTETVNTVDMVFHDEVVHGLATNGVAYRVPGSTAEIVLDPRPIHPFLAEYDRQLVLRQDNREILRLTAVMDSGGLGRMDLYRISNSTFYLEGTHSSDRYLLDTSKPSVGRHVLDERPTSAQYLGAFDRDSEGWRFIPACESNRNN